MNELLKLSKAFMSPRTACGEVSSALIGSRDAPAELSNALPRVTIARVKPGKRSSTTRAAAMSHSKRVHELSIASRGS